MGPGGLSHDIVFQLVGHTEGVPRTPVDVFSSIFTVFVILGSLVGIVVIGYTVYNAYTYRDDGGEDKAAESDKVVRPTLGALPTGSGGGKKLFVSFGISAIIVLSLIVWTYSALLYVEDTPDEVEDETMTIDVVGEQFAWTFTYPNGHESTTLRVPRGQTVELNVTSSDVFHNIGIPEFRVKTDAIPGQTTSVWFTPEETGTFEAVCYELCGSGHSIMRSDVIVMQPDEYQEWYENTTDGSTNAAVTAGGDR